MLHVSQGYKKPLMPECYECYGCYKFYGCCDATKRAGSHYQTVASDWMKGKGVATAALRSMAVIGQVLHQSGSRSGGTPLGLEAWIFGRHTNQSRGGAKNAGAGCRRLGRWRSEKPAHKTPLSCGCNSACALLERVMSRLRRTVRASATHATECARHTSF